MEGHIAGETKSWTLFDRPPTMMKRRHALRYWPRNSKTLVRTPETENGGTGSQSERSSAASMLKSPTVLSSTVTETYKHILYDSPSMVSNKSITSNTLDADREILDISPPPFSALHNPYFVCPFCGLHILSIQSTGQAWRWDWQSSTFYVLRQILLTSKETRSK